MCRLDRTQRRKDEGRTKKWWRSPRVKHGSGIKDRDDKSNGMEIPMTKTFAKINPTDLLILAKQAARRKRN
jgi:hypothetical protein